MARVARVVLPGCLHHVTQRGNHRQMVFLCDDDRRMYLEFLGKYLLQYHARLVGHSLMGNHVHLGVIPESADALAKAIGRTHQDYSRWFQLRRNLTGHLWQNRFFSCPVDEERSLLVLTYIESNPVRAGLVKHAWEWAWSSAGAHVTGRDATDLLDMGYWANRTAGVDWKQQLLEAASNGKAFRGIREATNSGRPWGSREFLLEAERRLGRHFLPRRQGRKPGFNEGTR